MSRRQVLGVSCVASTAYLLLALLTAHAGVFLFEERARSAVSLAHGPALDGVMRGVSFLGDSWGLIPLIVLTSAGLWRRHRDWATALPAIMLGTWALQLVAKWTTDRPRPNLAPLGFPSGHVLSLVVLFGLAAYVLCRVRSDRAARALGICCASTLLVMVAASRLYLEAHWILDVAGGFLLGLAYLMLLIWIAEAREGRDLIAAREPLPSLEAALAGEPATAQAPIVPSL
jgi:membrane-associated phospholipid phosphatase